MTDMKRNYTTELFAPTLLPAYAKETSSAGVRIDMTKILFLEERIDSKSAARKYPDSYILIAVEEKRDFGITYGKVLCVSASIESLNNYVNINNIPNNQLLHYVTGIDLL